LAARVVSSKDLVVISADGTVDLEASEAAIERLFEELEGDTKKSVIFDLRAASCKLSVAEVYGVVDFLAKHGSKRDLYGKVAIFLKGQAHRSKAEFFALTAQNRGLEARVFDGVEQLGEWLGADPSGLFGSTR
jgi:hypothetical protein